jgi:DNA-binding NtrC family response regulator
MPEIDGLELLRRIKTVEQSPVDVLVVTGHGDTTSAVKALKYGAFDYLQKPIDVHELAIVIERSAAYATLRENYRQLKEQFREQVNLETQTVRGEAEKLRNAYLEEIGLGGLGVFSEAMHRIVAQAEKYSTDRQIPVLVEGESGTGKELVARYIHFCSANSALSPFVAITAGGQPGALRGGVFATSPGTIRRHTRSARWGRSRPPTTAPCSWTRSARCPPRCR